MYSKFHFKVSSWGSNCIFPQKSWYTGWLGSPERLVNTEHFETPHVFNKTVLACIPIVNQDVPGQKGPGGQAGNLTTQYSKATSQGARGRTKELRGERDAGGTQTTPTGGRQSMKGDSGKNGWIPTLSVSSLPGTTHSPHRPIPNSAQRPKSGSRPSRQAPRHIFPCPAPWTQLVQAHQRDVCMSWEGFC